MTWKCVTDQTFQKTDVQIEIAGGCPTLHTRVRKSSAGLGQACGTCCGTCVYSPPASLSQVTGDSAFRPNGGRRQLLLSSEEKKRSYRTGWCRSSAFWPTGVVKRSDPAGVTPTGSQNLEASMASSLSLESSTPTVDTTGLGRDPSSVCWRLSICTSPRAGQYSCAEVRVKRDSRISVDVERGVR